MFGGSVSCFIESSNLVVIVGLVAKDFSGIISPILGVEGTFFPDIRTTGLNFLLYFSPTDAFEAISGFEYPMNKLLVLFEKIFKN